MRAKANAIDMVKYNMQDCMVNLKLCFKLDLVNQVVAICNITRVYIEDVMLYSTGAIVASALCAKALSNGHSYVWTRCDYHPWEFFGGHFHFKQPMVCVYPMIADFVSMYPSIMSSAKISPESIDYCDKDCVAVPRYSHKLVLDSPAYQYASLFASIPVLQSFPLIPTLPTTSSGVTESAISNSAVHNICPSTWCTHFNIPFACWFLTVVGLRLMPYDSYRYLKWSLNSLPL
jgi:DNA polymerase elongation subunit (family B)